MKTSFFFAALSWILLETAAAYAGSFAPLVELPDDISSSNISFLEAQTVKKSVVPDKEDVGVPAYPGSRILFTQAGNKASIKGIEKALPSRVFLATTAPFDTVVEFYSDHLEAWLSREESGSVIFFEETATDNPVEDLTIPKIVVSPDDPSRNLMPESQTIIDIYYYPQQQEQTSQEQTQ